VRRLLIRPSDTTASPLALTDANTADNSANGATDNANDNSAYDPDRKWRLHPRVALRPEPFGALAYHYGNRRLNFLRHPDLVHLVETLDQHPSINAALDASVEARRHPSFHKALQALAASNFLEAV